MMAQRVGGKHVFLCIFYPDSTTRFRLNEDIIRRLVSKFGIVSGILTKETPTLKIVLIEFLERSSIRRAVHFLNRTLLDACHKLYCFPYHFKHRLLDSQQKFRSKEVQHFLHLIDSFELPANHQPFKAPEHSLNDLQVSDDHLTPLQFQTVSDTSSRKYLPATYPQKKSELCKDHLAPGVPLAHPTIINKDSEPLKYAYRNPADVDPKELAIDPPKKFLQLCFSNKCAQNLSLDQATMSPKMSTMYFNFSANAPGLNPPLNSNKNCNLSHNTQVSPTENDTRCFQFSPVNKPPQTNKDPKGSESSCYRRSLSHSEEFEPVEAQGKYTSLAENQSTIIFFLFYDCLFESSRHVYTFFIQFGPIKRTLLLKKISKGMVEFCSPLDAQIAFNTCTKLILPIQVQFSAKTDIVKPKKNFKHNDFFESKFPVIDYLEYKKNEAQDPPLLSKYSTDTVSSNVESDEVKESPGNPSLYPTLCPQASLLRSFSYVLSKDFNTVELK